MCSRLLILISPNSILSIRYRVTYWCKYVWDKYWCSHERSVHYTLTQKENLYYICTWDKKKKHLYLPMQEVECKTLSVWDWVYKIINKKHRCLWAPLRSSLCRKSARRSWESGARRLGSKKGEIRVRVMC